MFGEFVTASSSTNPVTSIAICDDGDIVIEGGYQTNAFNTGINNVLINAPFAPDGDKYETYLVRMLGEGNTYRTHAYCFDNLQPTFPNSHLFFIFLFLLYIN